MIIIHIILTFILIHLFFSLAQIPIVLKIFKTRTLFLKRTIYTGGVFTRNENKRYNVTVLNKLAFVHVSYLKKKE